MNQKNGERFAVVVGSSGSIGRAISEALRAEGYKVIGWQRLTEISAQLDYVQRVDLSSEESISAAAKETLKIAKKVDVLVYDAGKLKVSTIDNLEVADWDEMFNVNVRGLYLVCKHLVRAAGVRVVVPIGSVAAHVCADESFAYTASKGGNRSLAIALAQVYAPQTRVALVSPAWVDGGFTDQVRDGMVDKSELEQLAREVHLLQRMCTPAEVADTVVFVASEKASFITGTEILVDGGFMIKK